MYCKSVTRVSCFIAWNHTHTELQNDQVTVTLLTVNCSLAFTRSDSCPAGLILVKDKKKSEVDIDNYVSKLAKRELTLEALPAALRVAIQDLKKS